MKSENNSPINKYDDIQYILDDYFENLPELCSRKVFIEDKLEKIDDNLTVWKHKDIYRIKHKHVYCPECHSKDVVENGYYPKDLVLLHYGLVGCEIKRYECKHCKKGFSTDISSIVDPNFTVSHEVMNVVERYYSIDFTSVRKIQEYLKEFHGVNISYQEIQNIIVDYHIHYNPKISRYSGYYAFDALWIKIKEISEKYVFLLTLIDVCHDTVVAYKVVEHETEEEVKKFLEEATRNQDRTAITTDLKPEYRKPINDLKFKHQFCKFHFKQNNNKIIRDYVKENNLPDEKIKEFKSYLPKLYEIYDVETQDEVYSVIEKLRKDKKDFPQVIQDIFDNKLAPYFKNLTYFLDDPKIESTSNLVERIFEDLAPKHIKKGYKTLKGFLSRFNLKLKRWDERNAIY